MSEEEKAAAEAVKTTEEGVKTEGEKAPVAEETVTMTKAEVEGLLTAAENATKLAEKKTEEYSNLQRWNMKLKTKLKDNGIDDEEEKTQAVSEERIAQIVKETIEKTIPAIVKPKEDDELAIANNKIAEMRIALANSKKPIASATGSNLEKETDDKKGEAEKFFSKEQVEEMKKKFPNISIEDIYKNMQKPGMGVQTNA
jgi:hypothetical protein